MLEFSEKWVSIIIDEESGSDEEPPALSMENNKTLDELIAAVTDECRKELEKD